MLSSIHQSSFEDFEQITQFVRQFELDNRDLQRAQFLVAKDVNQKIIGFGRIRKYNDCDELCSLGVIEAHRNKGIAKKIVEALINIATPPIYLVCIIPHYFEKSGFKIVTEFPTEISHKLNYCTFELIVPEEYVVMRYQK